MSRNSFSRGRRPRFVLFPQAFFILNYEWIKILFCFLKRLNLCNRTSFHKLNLPPQNTNKFIMLFVDFILIIISPLACVLGIASNVVVIFLVCHKPNCKELKENHYKYMALYSASNIIFLLIQPITLISECQSFEGLFCSQVRKFAFSQYFKIIFGEYFSNFLRLISNFLKLLNCFIWRSILLNSILSAIEFFLKKYYLLYRTS